MAKKGFLRGGDAYLAKTLEALRWIAQDLSEEDPRRLELLRAGAVLVEEQQRRAAYFTHGQPE